MRPLSARTPVRLVFCLAAAFAAAAGLAAQEPAAAAREYSCKHALLRAGLPGSNVQEAVPRATKELERGANAGISGPEPGKAPDPPQEKPAENASSRDYVLEACSGETGAFSEKALVQAMESLGGAVLEVREASIPDHDKTADALAPIAVGYLLKIAGGEIRPVDRRTALRAMDIAVMTSVMNTTRKQEENGSIIVVQLNALSAETLRNLGQKFDVFAKDHPLDMEHDIHMQAVHSAGLMHALADDEARKSHDHLLGAYESLAPAWAETRAQIEPVRKKK